MKLTFRWYGPDDNIPLSFIRQIPNMSGVVTACYDVPVGEIWKDETLDLLKEEANKNGLEMEVIESIPVHEHIKLGLEDRDHLIDNYIENIRKCAKHGVKCVCYNFMPVFDWLRTTMHYVNPDGSDSLAYSYEDFLKVDPKNLHLPGWDESYSCEELQSFMSQYQNMTHDDLFNHLVYLLNRIIPVCEEVDINMAIHPDDPPWDLFGLPRIITNEKNIDRFLSLVDSPNNGLTFCTGSLGADKNNDLVAMVDKYAKMGRIHFMHVRNIRVFDNGFEECAHDQSAGTLDILGIMKALYDNNFDGYLRPDHGRMIWGEEGKPGYGLYDRALGASYINGVWETLNRFNKQSK